MIGFSHLIRHIHDHLSHVSSIFPSDTNLTCTFTAHATANTWSNWTEIVDSGATSLSTAFAAGRGHITALLVESISEDDTIYMLEIAWGASHILMTTFRFAGGTKFQAPHVQDRFWAPFMPAGQTMYYRMKSATAVADTCTVHFRYHVH